MDCQISGNILEDISVVKTEMNSDNENEFEEYSDELHDETNGGEADHIEVYGSPIEGPAEPIVGIKEEAGTIETGYTPEVNYQKNCYTDVPPEVAKLRKKAREENSEPRLDCPICGDKVNGIHYGIYSCEGCKNFFKRSVTTNKFYTCYGSGNCDVKIIIDDFGVKQSRKGSRCQACRLQACLNNGMVYLGYGYNRSSRKIKRSVFKDMQQQQEASQNNSPTNTPTKKQRLTNHSALLDALFPPNSSAASALDPLSGAQPTASVVRLNADSVTTATASKSTTSSSRSSPSTRNAESEGYQQNSVLSSLLSRSNDSGSILASMLKAPLKESITSNSVANKKPTKCETTAGNHSPSNGVANNVGDHVSKAFSGLLHGNSGGRQGQSHAEEHRELSHLTREQSDIVIAMLREQLKYEREKNRDLKNRVEYKDTQVDSLEKQVAAMEKHADLTNKIINKQKIEIERMKMEINRIGLFRNLLSKNVPNGGSTNGDIHLPLDRNGGLENNEDISVNGHESSFMVKDEPIE